MNDKVRAARWFQGCGAGVGIGGSIAMEGFTPHWFALAFVLGGLGLWSEYQFRQRSKAMEAVE